MATAFGDTSFGKHTEEPETGVCVISWGPGRVAELQDGFSSFPQKGQPSLAEVGGEMHPGSCGNSCWYSLVNHFLDSNCCCKHFYIYVWLEVGFNFHSSHDTRVLVLLEAVTVVCSVHFTNTFIFFFPAYPEILISLEESSASTSQKVRILGQRVMPVTASRARQAEMNQAQEASSKLTELTGQQARNWVTMRCPFPSQHWAQTRAS